LRLRYAEFFAELAERADPHVRHGPDQQEWGERVAADYDNVRAAKNFALDRAPALAMRFLGRLTFFLWLRGGFAEGRTWVDAVLARAEGQPRELVGRVRECGSVIAERLGDIKAAARHADEAYTAFASVGDEHGMANALRERGKVASHRGDHSGAAAVFTELAELAERIGDRWNGAIALNTLGDLALQSGDWEQVVDLCGRSSILRRDLGDEWGSALAPCNVAIAELQLGRLSSAAASAHGALQASMKVDAKMVVAASIDTSLLIAAALGNMREAPLLAGVSERLREELDSIRDPFEDEFFARAVALLRESLRADAYEEAIQHGRELTLAEAAACALAATGDPD
jgi:tetratricopeptide (TPR) repeat protein